MPTIGSITIDDSGKEIVVREVFEPLTVFVFVSVATIFELGELGFIFVVIHLAKHLSVVFIFYFCFFLVWQIIILALIGGALWNAFGRQIIQLQEGGVVMTQKIGKYIWQTKTFKQKSVSNLRLEERTHEPRHSESYTDYAIVFDCSMQKRTLLRSLSRDQADLLLAGPLKALSAAPLKN